MEVDKITNRLLTECFELDEKNGGLIWKERPRSHFQTDTSWKAWNRRTAGSPVGYVDQRPGRGRREIWFFRRKTFVHRVVYAMTHDLDLEDVPEIIDHIDGDQGNNRPANLRAATFLQNVHNSGMYKTNTSGFKGVSRQGERFVAQISVAGRGVYLGSYETAKEAAAAYFGAAKIVHGEYLRETNFLFAEASISEDAAA